MTENKVSSAKQNNPLSHNQNPQKKFYKIKKCFMVKKLFHECLRQEEGNVEECNSLKMRYEKCLKFHFL